MGIVATQGFLVTQVIQESELVDTQVILLNQVTQGIVESERVDILDTQVSRDIVLIQVTQGKVVILLTQVIQV